MSETYTRPSSGRVLHGSLRLVRDLPAQPERAFAAFSDLQIRARWFRLPGEPDPGGHRLDFRVGGHEMVGSTFAVSGTPEHIEYRSQFLDIVENERIVCSADLVIDDRRRSLSLLTVELAPQPTGTRLTYTEQYALLAFTGDGSDAVAEREGGTSLLLNRLPALLARAA